MKNSGGAICPLTYNPLNNEEGKYSQAGLKRLSVRLERLEDLPLSAKDQRFEAVRRAPKMSIQGVQYKLSAHLEAAKSRFTIVDRGGAFILKPQSDLYPELPENEDLCMRLAESAGIEIPLHGLIYSVDGSLTYFIKRFDRHPRGQKLALEDFAQLSHKTRDTKYNASLENIVKILDSYSTFPALEKKKLFLRVIFNFLIGNEDMHLKNYSLISRDDKVELSPGYDLINSTIATGNAEEESALPLAGKKRKLKQEDFIDYFAYKRLHLNSVIVDETLEKISTEIPKWEKIIQKSFLSDGMKKSFSILLKNRRIILGL